MTILAHELKRGKLSLLIWTGVIAFMLAVCVLVYPEMGEQMGDVGAMFGDMGGFSAAFGMDQINFGEFIGFFAVECGNVLGLGGAFFAAIIGISALAQEEKEHTAEFLLTHPVSRTRILAEKAAALVAQIVVLNILVIGVTYLCALGIGEEMGAKPIVLMFLANFLMQLEIAAVTFGISAFLRRNSLGLGMGLAAVFYFLNIIANLTEEMKFLKYITPFGYTDGADIITNESINGGCLAVGGRLRLSAWERRSITTLGKIFHNLPLLCNRKFASQLSCVKENAEHSRNASRRACVFYFRSLNFSFICSASVLAA